MTTLREIIAEKRNARYGLSGFYDIRLIKQNAEALLIEIEQSIFFNFIPFADNPKITWTQTERDFFVAEWLRQIPAAWDKKDHTTESGFKLSLTFICNIRQASANTQWQANVMKLKSRNAYQTSAVLLNGYPDNFDAKFDSNDDLQKVNTKQTAMIHEYGHMIGLPDEYENSPHTHDRDSIMNYGSEVRDRHLAHFIKWAKPYIPKLANSEQKDLKPMNAYKQILDAKSKDEEIAAVNEWRENRNPDEDVYIVVRHRETKEEIPLGEITIDQLEELEVEFRSASAQEGEIFVWRPASLEALESLFLE